MFGLRINQVDLLRRAIRPFADMGARANINYSPDFIMLQTASSDISVTALLLIKSGSFESFGSSQYEGCVGIDPIIVHNILNSHVGPELTEWSVAIYGDDNNGIMRFYFRNDTRGTRRTHVIRLLNEAPYGRLDMRHLGLEFKAVVGIPSHEFRNNLVQLSSGIGLMVNVFITHNQLSFSTVSTEIILRKEMGECIIGGVAESDQPIEFSFSLEQMAAYQNASLVSSIVWILTPSPDFPEDPYMLNFPLRFLDIVRGPYQSIWCFPGEPACGRHPSSIFFSPFNFMIHIYEPTNPTESYCGLLKSLDRGGAPPPQPEPEAAEPEQETDSIHKRRDLALLFFGVQMAYIQMAA